MSVCKPLTLVLVLAASCFGNSVLSAEDLLLARGLQPPEKNLRDEPLAETFSLDKAVAFLDAASLHWQQTRQCLTCHTNFAALYARPGLPGDERNPRTVREFAEELVTKRWPEKGPRWDAEVVAAAAALAFNDALTSSKLHPVTRTALDRMWTVQREDGGWNWLKCGWPPMESDDHYGATLAAIAVGVAPEKYLKTDAAQKGLEKIKSYLRKNAAPTLHHRAMLLWAASYVPDLMNASERQSCIDELRKLQRPDGGWAAASLGDWQRADGLMQDTETSDGYGTGFALFVLRRGGVPAEDPTVQRGLTWIKTHQRVSGRWFTRSLNRDNHHFLTHAGTAFTLMALRECGAIQVQTAGAE